MARILLRIAFVGALFFSIPNVTRASGAVEIVENDIQGIVITVQESVVRVTGANGQTLYIYNVAGVRVKSIKVDGDDKRFDFNLPKGCYILKVGKTVRKISIR